MNNVKIYLHNLLLIMITTDLQYFGTISFIKNLIKQDKVYFDNNQPFTKMSFKNRMVIASAQGPLHLTIPIVGGRDQKTCISEIQIDYSTKWNEHHLKSIITNYKRAPFFEYYEMELNEIYSQQTVLLADFLLNINLWVKSKMKGNWELSLQNNNEQLNRFYDPYLPKNYFEIINPVMYQQVFEDKTGFLPNLCILDMLFCCGGKQANYLITTL